MGITVLNRWIDNVYPLISTRYTLKSERSFPVLPFLMTHHQFPVINIACVLRNPKFSQFIIMFIRPAFYSHQEARTQICSNLRKRQHFHNSTFYGTAAFFGQCIEIKQFFVGQFVFLGIPVNLIMVKCNGMIFDIYTPDVIITL